MNRHVPRSIILSLLLILLHACTMDPGKRFDKALENFRTGQPGALDALRLELIRYGSLESIDGSNLYSTGTVIYQKNEEGARIILPTNFDLSMIGAEGERHIDVSDRFAVISDGRQLSIFDSNGNHIIDADVGDEKNPVLNCTIDGETIIYYKEFNLYRYSINDNTSELIMSETFPPPYKKYYTVTFFRKGNHLGIAAGIAGSYYVSVIDLSEQSVILKNLQASSSKLHMGVGAIYYLTGKSGAWQLTMWTLGNKNKSTLSRFTDIVDIELSEKGYIREHSGGLEASSYKEEPTRIPFPYELAGKYGEEILLHYKSRYYRIDIPKLLMGLKKLNDTNPGVFSEKEADNS
jgi:hypothetical protein